MEERGLSIAHTTIMRWVHINRVLEYDVILKQPMILQVDETYVKVKGQWMYLNLYRAVDSEGNTIDFYLSESRDKQAAKCFFKKALAASHNRNPQWNKIIVLLRNVCVRCWDSSRLKQPLLY